MKLLWESWENGKNRWNEFSGASTLRGRVRGKHGAVREMREASREKCNKN